jgi:hypothetical protein
VARDHNDPEGLGSEPENGDQPMVYVLRRHGTEWHVSRRQMLTAAAAAAAAIGAAVGVTGCGEAGQWDCFLDRSGGCTDYTTASCPPHTYYYTG